MLVLRLLAEIRELGCTGSMNLLYRYITQGRAESDRPHLSSRRVARLLLTRPAALSDAQRALLSKLTAACPEMTSLSDLIRSFAALLRPHPGNDEKLQEWTHDAQAAGLPSVQAFTRGLRPGMAAAIAAVTLPFHNGRTEGVNTKTKMIKRQNVWPRRLHPPAPPHPAQLTTHRHHRKWDRAVQRTLPVRHLHRS